MALRESSVSVHYVSENRNRDSFDVLDRGRVDQVSHRIFKVDRGGLKRAVSTMVVLLIALVWSVSLSLFGLWLIDGGMNDQVDHRAMTMSGGIASLCGGQFVFLYGVNSRVFPSVKRELSSVFESMVGVCFLIALVLLGISSLLGLFSL